MKSRELINRAVDQLNCFEDALFSASTLFEFCFGKDYRLCFDDISEEKALEYLSLVARRQNNEPLQYIIGSWPFFGREYKVGPGVLIPRPETEEVVVKGLECINDIKDPVVIDLCAGSGCIGVSIAHERADASVTCVEMYPDAYSYLRENAADSGAEAVLADALDFYESLKDESIDLIISNPPYIAEVDYASLQREVLREPKTALVADEGGTFYYRRFAADYYKALKNGGYLVFEIGYDQEQAVAGILQRCGYRNVSVLEDSFGNPRIAIGQK